jgi:hypothetical protein
VRELQILVDQQTPQGVLERGHAGLVINKLSLAGDGGGRGGVARYVRHQIRAHLGTTSTFCKVVVLKLKTVPFRSGQETGAAVAVWLVLFDTKAHGIAITESEFS